MVPVIAVMVAISGDDDPPGGDDGHDGHDDDDDDADNNDVGRGGVEKRGP